MSNVSAFTKVPIDVTTASISELTDALEKGYLTSETLVKIYLERIEQYDNLFNAINQQNEHALEQARELDKDRANGNIKGRLHGIPILVKANIDVCGLPTTAGTKALIDNYPLNNATVVQKLIDEGAIILGSTNMSELAFSAANSYSSYGYVRNVFNTDYTSYGSSGGSAVSVAAAFAAASLGTDTNASVRLPASGAGLVGIRPTYSLVSTQGVIPYDYERDTVGVLSRNVSDNALLLSIISQNNPISKFPINKQETSNPLEGVNIGVLTEYVKGNSKNSGVTGATDPDIYNLLERSMDELEKLGANLVYLDKFVKSSNLSIASSTYAGITMCDYFDEYLNGTTGSIRSFKELAQSKGHVQSLSGYVKGCNKKYKPASSRETKKSKYREYVDDYFEQYSLDAVLYPTVKNKVLKYNETGSITPASSFGSVIGYPSITIPMGFASDGFSYNIEFLSQAYEEEKLYNIALNFEQANGNKIATSSLTPPLYTIPSEVEELKSLYEEALANATLSKTYKEWVNNTANFFKNYNEIENENSKAMELVEEYKILNKKEREEKKFQIQIIDLVLLPFVLASIFIIVKNFIKCFS